MPDLRVVRDETPALSNDELQDRGNDLASEARRAAVDAVRESMIAEFMKRGISLTRADLLRWRYRAREARAAWEKVEALTDELIREIDKNAAASRVGKKLVTVPDGSGRPGRYVQVWKDDTDD